MDKEIRTRSVNLIEILEYIKSKYDADTESSISESNSYVEVSDETFNDYLIVAGQIDLLTEMHFIDKGEREKIKDFFHKYRLEKLIALENRVTENKED